jgi:hypothetical protein
MEDTMLKRIILVFLAVVVLTVPLYGAEWQDNPVFIRGVEKNTVFTYYGTTFGGGDFRFKSHVLETTPYARLIMADKDVYTHSLYAGYVYNLSAERNLGAFVSHDLAWSGTEGLYFQTYPTTGNYYVESYRDKVLDWDTRLDLVYSQKLTDRAALGAAFTFAYTDLFDKSTFDTLAKSAAFRYRAYEYTLTAKRYYFAGTIGAAYKPVDSLELDLALEAGGFFGTKGYEEHLFNYENLGERHDYDNTGGLNGFSVRTRLDGKFAPGGSITVPFLLSYTYTRGLEKYDGLGTYTPALGAPGLYGKDYRSDYYTGRFELGAGVNLSPKGDEGMEVFVWALYVYDYGAEDRFAKTDKRRVGFNYDVTDTTVARNSHTIGLTAGLDLPITDALSLSGGLSYLYTFLNPHETQDYYRNFSHVSYYGYDGTGYEQFLGANLGVSYVTGNLNTTLSASIPIFDESDYRLDGPHTFPTLFGTDPIDYTAKRRDYSIILSISYSF